MRNQSVVYAIHAKLDSLELVFIRVFFFFCNDSFNWFKLSATYEHYQSVFSSQKARTIELCSIDCLIIIFFAYVIALFESYFTVILSSEKIKHVALANFQNDQTYSSE